MKGLDNLREYVTKQAHINEVVKSCVVAYIDKIEREVADMVPLPVDADGVPIHVGERVQLIGNDPSTVSHMSLAGDGWRVYVKYDGDLGTGSGEPSRIRHHHAPTVEDVLREFSDELWNSYCIGGTASDSGVRELEAEYAAKLRLAGDE